MVAAGRVLAVLDPDSAPIKRIIQEAKERAMLIDASYGRKTGADRIRCHSRQDHVICVHNNPLLLLPSILPSIRVFSNESVLHIRWPKYWSFSFSTSLSNEYSGFISLRIDWLDLLAVQGTLKSLLQHQSLKASILRHSAFFIVQLSHPYMTTGKKP